MPNFEISPDQKNGGLGKELLARLKYEARDDETGKIYCSERWNSSDGNVESEDNFPLVKEISKDEAWLDEKGFIKDEHR